MKVGSVVGLALGVVVMSGCVAPAEEEEMGESHDGIAVAAPSAPRIVFERDGATGDCRRIPSLVTVGSTYVALAERRHELHGSVCNDDGNMDLVLKTSADGRSWSPERMVVSSADLKERLKQPSSIFFDPSIPEGLPADRMYVRAASQAMANVDGRLVVSFQVTYNLVAECAGQKDCVNSPENVELGFAKARYFTARSDDMGQTWTLRRSHDDIYRSCVNTIVKDDALRQSLLTLFPDENYRVIDVSLRNEVVSEALAALRVTDTPALRALYTAPKDKYASFVAKLESLGISKTAFIRAYHSRLTQRYNLELTRALASDAFADKAARVARLSAVLGFPSATIEAHYAAIDALFRDSLRAGPGNAVVFPAIEGGNVVTRLFMPGGPLAFYSDDRSDSWRCSDTTATTKGSERQPAYLGNGRVVMTLRNKVNFKELENQYRRFAVSDDYGKTWGEAEYLVDAKGKRLLPDPISNAGLLAMGTGADRHLVLLNLANNTESIGDGEDKRRMLTLTRFAPGSLSPVLEAPCPGTQVHRSQYTVCAGSAGYAVLAQRSPSTVGVLFEATDDSGPKLSYRGWNESIRFVELPVSVLWSGNPHPACPLSLQ